MKVFSTGTSEEMRENLIRDGGRIVVFGGNPYEDDLESERSLPPEDAGNLSWA